MAITAASLAAKQRILSACVRLFLEKGYKRTTVAEILKAANVSASTFQNIFHTKDGVFIELVRFMFDNQFNIALKYTEQNFPPVFIYALETSIQLTLTELNENVREMYLEAYRQPQSAEYILKKCPPEFGGHFGKCAYFATFFAAALDSQWLTQIAQDASPTTFSAVRPISNRRSMP